MSLVSLETAGWLSTENFENRVLTELVRLFDTSTKSTIINLRFYCTVVRSSLLNCIVYLGRRHTSCWTHSPQARSCNKMAVFWSYFRDFAGAQKIEDLSKSINFFAEVFQITSRFLLARKKFGVRCNLTILIPVIPYKIKGLGTSVVEIKIFISTKIRKR